MIILLTPRLLLGHFEILGMVRSSNLDVVNAYFKFYDCRLFHNDFCFVL